jgi:large subunit ribosomal protein L6
LVTFTDEGIDGNVEIPDRVNASKDKDILIIKGRNGTIRKDFTKLPAYIEIEDKKIYIKPYGKRKKDLAIRNTARSIINNMIIGVEEGFTYKLKIVFAHFPISVKVKGKEIHVENFFGERSPRISKIIGEDTKVKVLAEDVLVEGPSLEDVSQTAANLESSTKVKNKDHRVFLDGLYIYGREEGFK